MSSRKNAAAGRSKRNRFAPSEPSSDEDDEVEFLGERKSRPPEAPSSLSQEMQLREAERNVSELQNYIFQLEQTVQRMMGESRALTQSEQALRQEISELGPQNQRQITELNQTLSQFTQINEQLRGEIDEYMRIYENQTQLIQELQKEVYDLKSDLQRFQQSYLDSPFRPEQIILTKIEPFYDRLPTIESRNQFLDSLAQVFDSGTCSWNLKQYEELLSQFPAFRIISQQLEQYPLFPLLCQKIFTWILIKQQSFAINPLIPRPGFYRSSLRPRPNQ